VSTPVTPEAHEALAKILYYQNPIQQPWDGEPYEWAEVRFGVRTRFRDHASAVIAAGWAPVADVIEACAQVAQRFVDHYPEDIWIPGGGSIDARSADVIRHMAPVIAEDIRALLSTEGETNA